MRTTRFILPLVALALCVMPAMALAAGGGTTQAIIKDVAKDGKVDGHYTTGQLKAALKSPLLKQYGGQGAVESILTRTKPQDRQGDARRRARPATCPSRAPTSSSSSPSVADWSLRASCSGASAAATTRLRSRPHRCSNVRPPAAAPSGAAAGAVFGLGGRASSAR